MHRRSHNLPGSARIREAFWRLEWAGAFGCLEVQVGKGFELVMEGSELPESSRSGIRHAAAMARLELSLPPSKVLKVPSHVWDAAHRCPFIWLFQRLPSSHWNTKPDSQRRHRWGMLWTGQVCLLSSNPPFAPEAREQQPVQYFQHGEVLVPRHLSLHTLLHAAHKNLIFDSAAALNVVFRTIN